MSEKTKARVTRAVLSELRARRNKEFASHHAQFFKTQKGGYGEGDLFWGLRVPQIRKVSGKYYKSAEACEIEELLQNEIHEARLAALFMLVEKYKRAPAAQKDKLARLYIRNAKYINNWDLVDLSAPHITGEYWFRKPSSEIWKFANSGNLWKERISLLAAFYFIRQKNFDMILRLAEHFLSHKHDLIHKASGWMLREAGKRDIGVLYSFLDKHSGKMPRTMLRYAIEKLSEKERKKYMERQVISKK